MFGRSISRSHQFTLVALGAMITVLLSFILNNLLQNETLLIFLAGVVFCSLTGGVWIGIGTSIVFGAIHTYYFQLPRNSFAIGSGEDAVILTVFLSLSVFLGVLGSRLRAALREAEEATIARESLLAAVSHDLRNPLSAAQMGIQLIKKIHVTGIPSEFSRLLEIIEHSVSLTLNLVNDLVDYEKSRRGRIVVDLKPESATSILHAVRMAFSPLVEAKNQSLEIGITAGDVSVAADSEQLLRVFSNLIGNAIKFTPDGGRIQVGCTRLAREVLFHVRDSGPGIPEEQIPFLFERYWQADKRSKHGLGLGLSIAKGIVEAHHGRIWVESKVGKGCVFFFTLPIVATENKNLKIA